MLSVVTRIRLEKASKPPSKRRLLRKSNRLTPTESMNRVINIGSEQKIKDGDVKTLDNEIVYSDIDMNAV